MHHDLGSNVLFHIDLRSGIMVIINYVCTIKKLKILRYATEHFFNHVLLKEEPHTQKRRMPSDENYSQRYLAGSPCRTLDSALRMGSKGRTGNGQRPPLLRGERLPRHDAEPYYANPPSNGVGRSAHHRSRDQRPTSRKRCTPTDAT